MPNRIIREGFLDSEAIDQLSDKTECWYHRLMLICDDAGRYDGRPQMVASRAYPLRDNIRAKDVEATLEQLVSAGLIRRYESKGKPFLQMIKWQRCGKAKTSKFPWIDGSFVIDYEKLDTRDGIKEFVRTSLPHADPMPTPCRPHADGVHGKTNTYTETETETETNNMSSSELDDAKSLLKYLNEKAGRQYRPVSAHLDLIRSRLKEPGVTVKGIRRMIDAKCAEWRENTDMAQYLRPQTLFNRSKFSAYYDAPGPLPSGGDPPLAPVKRSPPDGWERVVSRVLDDPKTGNTMKQALEGKGWAEICTNPSLERRIRAWCAQEGDSNG